MGQVRVQGNAVIKRRQNTADRPGVDAAIGMPADPAIDRTRIEARPAADALQALAERRRQHFRSAIVEQYQMKLVRAIEFARLLWPRDDRRIDRQRLPRRRSGKQLQEY